MPSAMTKCTPNASECPKLKKESWGLNVDDKISFLHGAGIMSWSDLGSLDDGEWLRAKEDMPQEYSEDQHLDPQRLGPTDLESLDQLRDFARREYLEGLNSMVCGDES